MREPDQSNTGGHRPGAGRLRVATSSRPSGSPEVDADVVLRARAGDDSAFAQLIEHYDEALRPLVHHLLGDPERSDRVLQEAYVKAYRGLPQFRRSSSPGVWLSRIVYHACLDNVRREARRSRRPSSTDEQPDEGEDRSALEQALHRLPLDQRAIVLLIDGDGLEHSAVADIVDLSPASVTSRLVKARTALRAALGDDQEVDDDPAEGSFTALADRRPLDDRRRAVGAIGEVADIPIGGERAGS